jgi:hypothetical protein
VPVRSPTARDPPGFPRVLRQALRGAAWLAAVVPSGLLLAACGGSLSGASPTTPPTTLPPAPAASHPAARSSPPAPGGVFGQPLLSPRVAVTPGGVYVAWQVSPPGRAVRSELARIDPASGHVEAVRRLGAAFGQATAAGGALWVVTWKMTGEDVLRLSPETLRLTGRWRAGRGGGQPLAAQVLAVAGGGLWVAGGNRLLHLSLPGGRVMDSVILPRAASSDLSANAAGTALAVGEADSGGRGAVQRRDPGTGAILASRPMTGVAAPIVFGPVGSAVWVSEATGMMGYVQRLAAATLAPVAGSCAAGRSTDTCLLGTNAITARLAGGLLWVTQPAGGNARNYCAEPSGRVLAPVRLPQPAQDEVLAIAPRWIFYAGPGPKARQYLYREPSPAACQAP